MKWYDGKKWHLGPGPAGAKGQVDGRKYRVLVGSRDQRGLSFDEIEKLPGHWREGGTHQHAKEMVRALVSYELSQ